MNRDRGKLSVATASISIKTRSSCLFANFARVALYAASAGTARHTFESVDSLHVRRYRGKIDSAVVFGLLLLDVRFRAKVPSRH